MADQEPLLTGQRIIIGLTGGIACYKVAGLVSKLVQQESTVDVIMTEAATRFVTPLTFASLTGRPVFDSQWTCVDEYDPQHIRLAKAANAMLIAPCTMDMLAKLACGMADDPVSMVASAIDRSTTPVLLAPSMNATMISQPATERNMKILAEDRSTSLDSEEGWQACKTVGTGRLPEPETLLQAITSAIT